jgi:hypothetical protein
MSDFIALDALQQPAQRAAFDLWLPNPVMGRALFLRLPLNRGWTFEFSPAEAEASRFMVYRDRMWVSEGKARIFATRTDGSRVELNVTVKRWKPRIPECQRSMAGWRLFRHLFRRAAEELMESRCCRTERQIRIAWKAENARSAPRLLSVAWPSFSRGCGIRTRSWLRASTGGTALPATADAGGLARSDVALLLSDLHCH